MPKRHRPGRWTGPSLMSLATARDEATRPQACGLRGAPPASPRPRSTADRRRTPRRSPVPRRRGLHVVSPALRPPLPSAGCAGRRRPLPQRAGGHRLFPPAPPPNPQPRTLLAAVPSRGVGASGRKAATGQTRRGQHRQALPVGGLRAAALLGRAWPAPFGYPPARCRSGYRVPCRTQNAPSKLGACSFASVPAPASPQTPARPLRAVPHEDGPPAFGGPSRSACGVHARRDPGSRTPLRLRSFSGATLDPADRDRDRSGHASHPCAAHRCCDRAALPAAGPSQAPTPSAYRLPDWPDVRFEIRAGSLARGRAAPPGARPPARQHPRTHSPAQRTTPHP
jgi:hypothetical protein